MVIDLSTAGKEDEEIAMENMQDGIFRQAEDGGRTREAFLEERLQGEEGWEEQEQEQEQEHE